MGDGVLRVTSWVDIVVGTILREVHSDGTCPQFGDSAIVAVEADDRGATYVRLARPHVKVENGSVWTRCEELRVEGSRLVGDASIFRTVCLDRGQAASVNYSR